MKPLLPILLLAAFVRLWGLADQPVLYFDSGQYLGEARFLSSAARAAAGGALDLDQGASSNPLERAVKAAAQGAEAHPPDNAKVGHAILLATSMLIFGSSAFAAVLVSSVAAIATVAATYAIGAIGWGQRVAIPAALLLAVSGWHLTYSREAYAEADTILFSSLGYLVYLRGVLVEERRTTSTLLLTGALLGLAFACNTRASYLLAVLLPTEVLIWKACGWRRWPRALRRELTLGAGWLAPLALIEAVYLVARALGRAFGSSGTWPDYAQQLAAYWQQHPVVIRADQWPSFFVDLALLDGIPVLMLLVAGVIAALVRLKRRQDVLLLTALLVPIALYSVYVAGAVRMRAFSLALPWVMLAAALGLNALIRSPFALRQAQDELRMSGLKQAFLAIATAALVLLALPRDWEILSARNGVPTLLRYLNQNGITEVAGTDGAVLGFYIGEDHTNAKFRAAYINSLDDLGQLSDRYRFLAVDMQGYLFPNELAERYLEAQPVFTTPHGSPIWYLASMLENRGVRWGEWDVMLEEWQHFRAAATELRLEDIRQLVQH